MSETEAENSGNELPRLRAPMPPQRLVAVLDEAAKRGKLPEFEPGGEAPASGPGQPLFTMLAYGTPWDADLIGEVEAAGGGEGAEPGGGQTTVRYRLQIRRRMPVIFAITLVLTVEPGRYFMDELLATFFPALHGHVPTLWWWYPVTIIPIPWLWRGWVRKSRKTTGANARERIGQMAEIVAGEVMG